MNMKKLAYTILASSVLVLCAGPTHAGLILTLSDGTNSVSIEDGSTIGNIDFNSAAGAVTWMGNLGVWYLNVSTGISNSPGTNGQGILHLNSVDNSIGAGALTITLSSDGYITPSGLSAGALTSVGGYLNGSGSSILFNSYVNGISVGGPLSFNTNSSGTGFGQNISGGFSNMGSTYNILQSVTLNHGGAGISSFDINTEVPEPATLGLMGLGLIGLAFVRRNRRA